MPEKVDGIATAPREPKNWRMASLSWNARKSGRDCDLQEKSSNTPMSLIVLKCPKKWTGLRHSVLDFACRNRGKMFVEMPEKVDGIATRRDMRNINCYFCWCVEMPEKVDGIATAIFRELLTLSLLAMLKCPKKRTGLAFTFSGGKPVTAVFRTKKRAELHTDAFGS